MSISCRRWRLYLEPGELLWDSAGIYELATYLREREHKPVKLMPVAMSVVMLLMCIGGMLLMTPYELGYYYYYLKEKNIRWDWVNKIQALIILSYQCNIYIYIITNQYTVYSFSYTRRFRIVFGVPQSIVQVRARLTGWNPLGCHGPNGGHDCGRCGGAGPGGVLGWHSRYAWPGFCLRESSLLDHHELTKSIQILELWFVGWIGELDFVVLGARNPPERGNLEQITPRRYTESERSTSRLQHPQVQVFLLLPWAPASGNWRAPAMWPRPGVQDVEDLVFHWRKGLLRQLRWFSAWSNSIPQLQMDGSCNCRVSMFNQHGSICMYWPLPVWWYLMSNRFPIQYYLNDSTVQLIYIYTPLYPYIHNAYKKLCCSIYTYTHTYIFK